MKHLKNAFERVKDKKLNDNTTLGEYIHLNEEEHSVKFVIQNGPIKPFGLNGCQVTDILSFCLELYHSLNETLPCQENLETIRCLGSALNWQIKRTQDRINRSVEGYQLDKLNEIVGAGGGLQTFTPQENYKIEVKLSPESIEQIKKDIPKIGDE